MVTDPEYVELEAVTALVRTAQCSHQDLGPTISRLFEEMVTSNPDAECIAPPCIYYADWRESDCDIEAAFPVDPATLPGTGTTLKTYPACTAITVTVNGSYDKLPNAWLELMAYIKDNNVDVYGAPWDSYVTPPNNDPESAVTELYVPLRSN